MPFITEKLWSSISSRTELLITHDWPEYISGDLQNLEADREIQWVISLIEQIRSIRSELRIPAGAKVPLIQIKLETIFSEVLDKNKILIERLARLSSISISNQKLDGIVTVPVEGGEFALDVRDLIDLPAEKARISKTVKKNNDEIIILKNKILNEKFMTQAPVAVINEARLRLTELDQNLIKLSSALNRLKDMD